MDLNWVPEGFQSPDKAATVDMYTVEATLQMLLSAHFRAHSLWLQGERRDRKLELHMDRLEKEGLILQSLLRNEREKAR
jgi:hypothetical protein